MAVAYRLGIDIGTNSLGWWALILSPEGRPVGTLDCGVRIFSDGRDPQSGASLAQARREARAARRRRDRFLLRKEDLMDALVASGLMPAAPEARKELEGLDPYELRAKGLDGPLPPHRFGRAIFHLSQRRGFKSNRKTDKGKDEQAAKETADMKGAIDATGKLLHEKSYRTLGEYLWKERRDGRSVRGTRENGFADRVRPVRARPTAGKGGRNEYEMYFSRDMYLREFDALWTEQAKHHPEICTPAARERIEEIIFRQRPLREVDPGPCTFIEGDKRAPLALPLVQQFRILQELANLEIADSRGQNPRRLTRAERDKLLGELKRREKVPFNGRKSIRALLNLPTDCQFNLEDAKRDELKGDRGSVALAHEKCFGAAWHDKPEAEQTAIVEFLLREAEESAVAAKAKADWGLSDEAALAVSAARLPEGYGRVGIAALRRIVPRLRDGASPKDGGLMRYDDAVLAAGFAHHSGKPTGEIMDALPYYGKLLQRYTATVQSPTAPEDERKYGRIANPTVHIGLNQLKKLVNDLIAVHGHPAEIVVELARDLKLGAEERERIQKEQAENKKKNDARREKLSEQGQEWRGDGLLRLRLWEELNPDNVADRKCVYTGRQISIAQLLSDEVEIDHILPFKLSLDDSPANLTVSYRAANRLKGNRAPHDAFKDSPPQGTTWDEILLRVAELPKNKQWRFRPDAMELVRDRAQRALEKARGTLSKEEIDEIERAGGFLARQLVDTAYLARVARQYLWNVCNPNRVRVVPGRLTALLRRHWGLNRLLLGNKPDPEEQGETATKRRDDHRHHAIDAFVVACTDLSTLQRVSAAADQERNRLIDNMPPPWDGFQREEMKSHLDGMLISFRPDHGIEGKLHKETAFGIVRSSEGDATTTRYVARKRVTDLKKDDLPLVRDRQLREGLLALYSKSGGSKISWQEALANFSASAGVRSLRVYSNKREGFVSISDDAGKYKAYEMGENHSVEILETANGSWKRRIMSRFEANSGEKSTSKLCNSDERLLFHLHKGDLLRLLHEGKDDLFRVVTIEADRIRVAQQFTADTDNRKRLISVGYASLKGKSARKVTVNILGRVRDPGPPA